MASHSSPPLSLIDRDSFSATLRNGAAALEVALNETQIMQLLDYLTLLSKWNAVYNLTSVRDPKQMVSHHLLDSLSVITAIQKREVGGVLRVLDVGAGGGLPGMVIAIWAKVACPGLQLAMIDTVHKKTAFLTQVKTELELSNVTVHTGRVEQLQTNELFDVITSRAFAELPDFVNCSAHLLAPSGCFIAMKGTIPDAEIRQLPAGWHTHKIQRLDVPTLIAERHLIWIKRDVAEHEPSE